MTVELDVAVARLRDWVTIPAQHTPLDHATIIVLAALEAAQADARRYRWLRDQMWSQAFTNLYAIPVAFADTADKAGEGIDAAIDAAMGEQ